MCGQKCLQIIQLDIGANFCCMTEALSFIKH